MLGDFNGDGKADLFISDDKEKKHYVAFSKGDSGGDGFLDAVEIEKFDGKLSDIFTIGDVNGDGKDDIIAEGISSACVAYAQGDGAFYYEVLSYPNGMFDIVPIARHFIDYHGTGKKALCYVNVFNNSRINILSFHSENAGERQHAVKSIRNGMNESISFEYLPLTKRGDFYKKEFLWIHPVAHILPPLYAVSKLKREDGTGGQSINEYSYQGAKVYRLGRGFLGFSEITVKNSVLDVKTISYYDYDKSRFTTYLDRQKTCILSSDENINEMSIAQKATDLGDKRYFSYIETTYAYDKLKDITIETKFIYDDAGNITEQKKEYKKLGNILFTETNKYKYGQYGGWGAANRLVNDTTITKHADDAKSYTRSISYEYDSKGNMKKAISDVGVTTSYNINGFGLVDKKTVSAPEVSNYIEDFV
jgi:hypothetical protein